MRARPTRLAGALLGAALALSGTPRAAEGFYADLFMDGGVSLTSRTTLPAAAHLGLSMEYLATDDQGIQDKVIVADIHDDNGVLLYPDGEPRFRCVYLNGGAATAHGTSLGAEGRQRFRDHFANGGSYTGSCAGAFIATLGWNTTPVAEYLHLWPGMSHTTGLLDAHTGHFIPPGSPLLAYSDFGGDLHIANVRHNGGCYVIENDPTYWVPGSEVLLTYDYLEKEMHGNPSCWAYQESLTAGRLVVIGSHPEGVTSGERLDLMAAILQYALDGGGLPTIKGSLSNGVAREMDDNGAPGHERIGDKQYHHFTMSIPPNTGRLTVTLSGDDTYDLDLYLRQGDFALRNEPGVISAANGTSSQETITADHPVPGTWLAGVKCHTTVGTAPEDWGTSYTGQVGVLNGVSYTITAEWEPEATPAGLMLR